MYPFIWLILTLINLYMWAVIISVIVELLANFRVLDARNPFVGQVRYALRRLTEPALAPIRRLLPDLGGIDISPVILIVLLQFAAIAINQWTQSLL
ncbi:MAG: YggT family protein [Hyphomicrobiales bacterium]